MIFEATLHLRSNFIVPFRLFIRIIILINHNPINAIIFFYQAQKNNPQHQAPKQLPFENSKLKIENAP